MSQMWENESQRPGREKKPTLREVARLAGTSVSTASVVLSRTSNKFVSEPLRRRVMEAATQLQYRPNIPARRMRGKPGRFLAILVPQFENVYFNRIVISAENYANAHDYILSIFSTFDEEERELKFINNLISLQVDGVLISPARYKSASVELLRQEGIPFVVIDRAVEGRDFDFVTTDYYRGGYEAARLLLEHGHRRLAFFGWANPLKVITDRRVGFEAAIRAAGLSPEEVVFWEGERSREAARRAAHEVFHRAGVTGVFAGHHQIGEGIVAALRDLGKRVPEDVSVVIFGNPPWASIISPSFTCVAQPESAIGTKAAELMIKRLEDPAHVPATYILPIEVFIRESVRKLG